jgi:phosphoserine phosphatase
MKLYLVRHGETQMNVKGLIQSHSNHSLNKNGISQAEKIANRLRNEQIDFIYSSDLDRAKETAQEIGKHHSHITLIETPKLREKKAGILEGMEKKEAQKKFNKDVHKFHSFKPEGAESFEEAQQRIAQLYNKLLKKHKGKSVLLVAHGAIIGALLLFLLEKPLVWKEYDNHRPTNAALTILEIEDNKKHKIHLLNCVEHLV